MKNDFHSWVENSHEAVKKWKEGGKFDKLVQSVYTTCDLEPPNCMSKSPMRSQWVDEVSQV
jgi:hypothetical protein